MEPVGQGILLLLNLKLFMYFFGLDIKKSLIYFYSVSPIGWYILARYIFKTYKYSNKEWGIAIIRNYLTLFIKYFVLYYLLTNLHKK